VWAEGRTVDINWTGHTVDLSTPYKPAEAAPFLTLWNKQ